MNTTISFNHSNKKEFLYRQLFYFHSKEKFSFLLFYLLNSILSRTTQKTKPRKVNSSRIFLSHTVYRKQNLMKLFVYYE